MCVFWRNTNVVAPASLVGALARSTPPGQSKAAAIPYSGRNYVEMMERRLPRRISVEDIHIRSWPLLCRSSRTDRTAKLRTRAPKRCWHGPLPDPLFGVSSPRPVLVVTLCRFVAKRRDENQIKAVARRREMVSPRPHRAVSRSDRPFRDLGSPHFRNGFAAVSSWSRGGRRPIGCSPAREEGGFH